MSDQNLVKRKLILPKKSNVGSTKSRSKKTSKISFNLCSRWAPTFSKAESPQGSSEICLKIQSQIKYQITLQYCVTKTTIESKTIHYLRQEINISLDIATRSSKVRYQRSTAGTRLYLKPYLKPKRWLRWINYEAVKT